MLGRRVALLLRTSPSTRLHHLSLRSRQSDLIPRSCVSLPSRTYSTPGRPKKAVGEPSRPVKRGVKRAPAKAKDTVTATTEKSAPKKKATPKGKASPTKAAAKKSKKAKKPAQTPEQIAKAEKRQVKAKAEQEKNKIKELMARALTSPVAAPTANAFSFFVSEKMQSHAFTKGQSAASMRVQLGDRVKAIAAEWKSLPVSEIEHYNHLANTKREENLATYKRWVESYTTDEIKSANTARKALRRMFPVAKAHRPKWPAIDDERTAKPAKNAYIIFAESRHASGDFKNIALVDRVKLISKEWHALNQEDKERYHELQAKDVADAHRQLPPIVNGEQQAAAAAS